MAAMPGQESEAVTAIEVSIRMLKEKEVMCSYDQLKTENRWA